MPATLAVSAAQQFAIDHRGTDLQVIACAGSGKTESISRRVAALIAEGAPPASIVAFTFTERAATELKERITRRVAERLGPDYCDRLGPMFVGTIHAYCFRLLQDHVPQYGNYDVLDEHRHAGFLSRVHRSIGLGKLRAKHWAPISDFMRTVDVIGNECIPASALDGTPLGECYNAYRDALHRYHFLTFGLIITSALEALERPEVFARVHGSLRHLLVDEYQDINPAQERLIATLAQPPVQLTVVGDDDQSIYQWRGSDVRNILTFRARRPQAESVTLDTNRRSRPAIVSAANAFAQTIPERLAKEMQPARDAAPHQVTCWTAPTDHEEAERIATTIEALHDAGYRYRDIAVLFRSVRTSAPPIIEVLRERNIPYTAGGRTGLFLQPEVAHIAEIYAWFVGGDWQDERYGEYRPADIDHCVAVLAELFGHPSVDDLRAYIQDWRDFVLRGHRPVNLVGDYYRLLHELGAHRIDLSTPVGSARMGALARFSEVLGDFEHIQRRGRQVEKKGVRTFEGANDRGRDYFRALHNYLLHYARDAYEEFEGEPAVDLDAVDILTIHQAKGLEWPIVFVPSLVQGRFPSRRAGQPQDWLLPEAVFPRDVRRRYEGGDAEERRLFYVALTRARDAVYLSAFERKQNRFQPSEYFTEIAEHSPVLPAAADPLPAPAAPAAPLASDAPGLDVSFSDLAVFEDCGHRYRLSTVLGFQTQVAPELGYGRAIHHVLRQVAETVRATGRVPDDAAIDRLLNDEFFVPFASPQAWQTMRKAARKLVTTYVRQYAADLHRVWAVERPFALHLDEGIVSGRADVILDQEGGRSGSLAIVDYKVATDESREARYEEQLRVYTVAGRGEGLQVEAAYLHELRDGSRHAVDIGEGPTEAAMSALHERVRDLRAAVFVPKPTDERCGRCEYSRVCAHTAAPELEG